METIFSRQIERDFRAREGGRGWLAAIRREAYDRFAAVGFPTPDSEEWRYTSLEPIVQSPFHLAEGSGIGRPQVSGGSAPGVVIGRLSDLLQRSPEVVENLFRRIRPSEGGGPFVALNTAFFKEGALVYLPKGTVLKEPIEITYAMTPQREGTVFHPRNLILAEEGCEATVVERYTGEGSHLTNAVTEIVLGEATRLDHYRLQEEGERAFHVADVRVRQGRQSRWISHAVSLGGVLSRTEVRTILEGEGAECTLNGLYLADDRRHVDHQTSIDHATPHGTSQELYKGILDGHATAVFNGRIVVRPQAQKTNARQSNKNLLLSDDAAINTKPLLEILANDVKCNHGATIGRLDETQVFYLRSRGLGKAEARTLLTYAFASEVVERMGLETVGRRLKGILMARLNGNGRGRLAEDFT